MVKISKLLKQLKHPVKIKVEASSFKKCYAIPSNIIFLAIWGGTMVKGVRIHILGQKVLIFVIDAVVGTKNPIDIQSGLILWTIVLAYKIKYQACFSCHILLYRSNLQKAFSSMYVRNEKYIFFYCQKKSGHLKIIWIHILC